MSRLAVLVLSGTIGLAACQTLDPPEQLVLSLRAAGVLADLGAPFPGVLLGGQGTAVCVGDESVQVYVFPDVDATIDAAATINRDDPSSIGNANVAWAGPPRFWIRDRAIIQYVGNDVAVDAALRSLLGRPFAESEDPGRGPRLGATCKRAS